MKTIFKTVYHKKFFTILTLSVLFLFTLASIQILVTTNSKHQTLVDRVDEVNGAHTIVYISNSRKVEDAIAVASKFGRVEQTNAFPYLMDVYRLFEETQTYHGIIFEGYIEGDTNTYRVLEGKPLDELTGFEVAITESYARKLRKDNQEVLGYVFDYNYLNKFYVDPDFGEDAEFVQDLKFTVASIIDYPNFNILSLEDETLEKIPLFNRPMNSVGIVNQETIQSLEWMEININESHAVYPRYEYRSVLKVQIEDYTLEKEKKLEAELLNINGIYFDAGISVYPLHSLAQFLSTEDILFKQVSFYIVGGLILSTAYTFYVFLRRQLISNAKTIGTLGLLGIQQNRLILAYMSQILVIGVLSLSLWGGMNIFLQQLYLTDRTLASLIDLNGPIFVRMLPLFLGYVLIIVAIYYAHLKRYVKNSFLMSKSADKKYLSLPAIQQKGYALSLSIKTMLSSLSHSLGVILNIGIIVVTLLISLSFYKTVSTIYNEETLGIKFDYIVFDSTVEQYDQTKEFSRHQAVVQKVPDMYFIDILYSENTRVFYRSNLLVFYDFMSPFVPLVEGTNISVDDWNNLGEHTYYYEFSHATRRHIDLRDAIIYDVNKISGKGSVERMHLFYLASQFHANTETATQIKGKVNSLIDNGWVAYIQTKNSVNKFTFPVIDTYFAQVDEANKVAFLNYLDKEGLKQVSYEEVMSILQENNDRVVGASLQIMLSASILLLIILVINQTIALMGNLEENQEQHKVLRQIGVSSKIIRKKLWIQEITILALGLVLAALLYLVIYPFAKDSLLKAYGLFTTIPLSSMYYAVYGAGVIVLLLIIALLSHHKTRV